MGELTGRPLTERLFDSNDLDTTFDETLLPGVLLLGEENAEAMLDGVLLKPGLSCVTIGRLNDAPLAVLKIPGLLREGPEEPSGTLLIVRLFDTALILEI